MSGTYATQHPNKPKDHIKVYHTRLVMARTKRTVLALLVISSSSSTMARAKIKCPELGSNLPMIGAQ